MTGDTLFINSPFAIFYGGTFVVVLFTFRQCDLALN
jgi:hypothetical protein